MTTTRQHKVSRLLQKELGDYFQKNGSGITGGKMVTVTVVRISPDLGVSKVYLSLFPGEGSGGGTSGHYRHGGTDSK